jgi:hypothetical protein
MDKTSKLLYALQQVEGVAKLMEGDMHILRHLSPIHVELKRQLSNAKRDKNGKDTD